MAESRFTDKNFRDFKASRRTRFSYLIPVIGIGTIVGIIVIISIITINNKKNKENED